MSEENYIQNPYQCPFCSSKRIVGEQIAYIQPCGKVAWATSRCKSCHRAWWDEYHLSKVIDRKERRIG